MAIANTVEVSSTSPCGIMPTTDATVERMASLTLEPSMSRVRRNSPMPSGKMSSVASSMMMFRVSRISERAGLMYFAPALILAAYESAPTRVRRAHTEPESTKLPENSSDPTTFSMAWLSPVSRLSLSSADPDTTTASAGTWSPRASRTTSSSTSSSKGSSTVWEPRRTRTVFAVRIESLSTMRLARISWKTPMTRFEITTPMNSAFLIWPVTSTSTNMITLIPLNNVNAWSAMICRTVLVWTSELALTLPWALRSATSCSERPAIMSWAVSSMVGRYSTLQKDKKMVPPGGIEPTTFRSGGERSIH